MPKLKFENYHYSQLEKKNVGKPTWLECKIVKLNSTTAEVFVPKIGKNLIVKRWKLQEDDQNNKS